MGVDVCGLVATRTPSPDRSFGINTLARFSSQIFEE